MTQFSESVVEQAALAWLESIGWQVRNGAENAPGRPTAEERDDHGQVVPAQRLCASLLPLASGDLRLKGVEKFIGRLG